MRPTAIPEILGHRGARGESPENTLPSFLLASNAGVAGIELDVRMSADEHLVVFHDKDLKRTTGKKGLIATTPSEQLLTLNAGLDGPYSPIPTPIPTLENILTACSPQLHYQLEVKGSYDSGYLQRLTTLLLALVEKLHMRQRVVITSESKRFLRLVRQADKTIPLGFVCHYRYRRPIATCQALDCRWLIAHYNLTTARLMKQAQHNNLQVSCWTVNDLDEAERLARLNVASIITDYPTALLAHFRLQQNLPKPFLD